MREAGIIIIDEVFMIKIIHEISGFSPKNFYFLMVLHFTPKQQGNRLEFRTYPNNPRK